MSALSVILEQLNRRIVWHPSVPLKSLSEFDAILHHIRAQVDERERVALQCVVTLDRIAAWHEGAQVDATFEEPHAAQLARQQLAALGITGPLNPEHIDGNEAQASTRIRSDGQG